MRISGINIQNILGSLSTATIEVDCVDAEDISYMHYLYSHNRPCKLISYDKCDYCIGKHKQPDQSELKIERVIFNDPATIVFWNDGTKTVVKCDSKDHFSEEMGLAMACTKKLLGNNYTYYGKFDKALDKARTLN
jgi:hypothetical protein